MKNWVAGTALLALALGFPLPTQAWVDLGVSISLPLPIVFPAPPELVVIPGTYLYVVPDVEEEIFFYSGWWWRPWQGGWYRSRHYDSGWAVYHRVPPFYSWVPSGWRDDYRDHRWGGRPWDHRRIPHQQVQKNWNSWERNRHWEREKSWGVQGMKPRTRPPQPNREARPKPQESRPQNREFQPQQRREVQHEQPRELQPRERREVQPGRREVQPQPGRPQPGEVRQPQPGRPQPQRGVAPGKSGPRPEKPERGDDGKRDRK